MESQVEICVTWGKSIHQFLLNDVLQKWLKPESQGLAGWFIEFESGKENIRISFP